jgi:hypothetical protein
VALHQAERCIWAAVHSKRNTTPKRKTVAIDGFSGCGGTIQVVAYFDHVISIEKDQQ